jgi:hypothetical protein
VQTGEGAWTQAALLPAARNGPARPLPIATIVPRSLAQLSRLSTVWVERGAERRSFATICDCRHPTGRSMTQSRHGSSADRSLAASSMNTNARPESGVGPTIGTPHGLA